MIKIKKRRAVIRKDDSLKFAYKDRGLTLYTVPTMSLVTTPPVFLPSAMQLFQLPP
jgi:hypothetical protein